MAGHYVAVSAGPSESGILEAVKAGGLSEREAARRLGRSRSYLRRRIDPAFAERERERNRERSMSREQIARKRARLLVGNTAVCFYSTGCRPAPSPSWTPATSAPRVSRVRSCVPASTAAAASWSHSPVWPSGALPAQARAVDPGPLFPGDGGQGRSGHHTLCEEVARAARALLPGRGRVTPQDLRATHQAAARAVLVHTLDGVSPGAEPASPACRAGRARLVRPAGITRPEHFPNIVLSWAGHRRAHVSPPFWPIAGESCPVWAGCGRAWTRCTALVKRGSRVRIPPSAWLYLRGRMRVQAGPARALRRRRSGAAAVTTATRPANFCLSIRTSGSRGSQRFGTPTTSEPARCKPAPQRNADRPASLHASGRAAIAPKASTAYPLNPA
jgi:hypothetical protein